MKLKRNQIKQYLKHKSAENKKIEACYLDELCVKKDHFVEAYNEQQLREDLSKSDLEECIIWCNIHQHFTDKFIADVESWLETERPVSSK